MTILASSDLLEYVIANHERLRGAGVLRLVSDGVEVDLAPLAPEAAIDEGAPREPVEPESPMDPLDDPDTYGFAGRVPRLSVAEIVDE